MVPYCLINNKENAHETLPDNCISGIFWNYDFHLPNITQLKKYAKQKENKELAAYAKGMLHAFNVYDHLRYARGKYEKWKKAPKGFKKELAKRDYEEAQDNYYKSRSKLPRRMIMSFPVIKDIR